MDGAPDPDEFFDNYLAYADPDRPAPALAGAAALWRAWWEHRWVDAADDPCARLARTQGFVLTTAQVRRLGLLPHDARREVRRQRWTSPAHGVVAPLAIPAAGSAARRGRRRHVLAATAAALVRPGHVISGRSAAVLHGLPTLDVPAVAELTAHPSASSGRRRAHVRGATLSEQDVTTWFGAPITTIARTIADLARHDRRDGLMALDAALHEGLVELAAVEAVLAGAAGWPGVRQARELISLGSAKAESPLESLTRLGLYDSGFPAPELQLEIGPYRVDFVWPEQRVILEADGRAKSTEEERWREKRRDLRLGRLGYTVIRVIWSDVMYEWAETRIHIAEKLGLPADFANLPQAQ
jgi:very-short-patch-repair endonuclease